MRDPDRIPMIIGAVARRWADFATLDLGPFLLEVLRALDPAFPPDPLGTVAWHEGRR